ncbi:MAG: hypothetical protein K2X00_17170 [Nitrospiraceae bacterium]|nr:hypothetical protein [Nitrospiraceae bacterium]
MTPQQFIGFGVRLFAIWLAISASRLLILSTAIPAQSDSMPTLLPYLLAALYFVAAVLLWFFPMVVAHRLLPRTSYSDALTLPSRDALMVGCILLGIWLILVDALPAVSWYAIVAALWLSSGQPVTSMEGSAHIKLFVGATSLVAGALLVTKAAAIVNAILRKRNGPAA